MNLNNGKVTYGRGSWASSMRYHNGTYYVTTFAETTGKTISIQQKILKRDPGRQCLFNHPITIIPCFLMMMVKCI